MPLDDQSILPYFFSLAGNLAFCLVYLALSIFHFLRWSSFKPAKHKWTLVLPISEFTISIGYALRVACRYQQDSVGLYATASVFVVLSPAAFLAFTYLILSQWLSAAGEPGPFSSHFVSRCFIWSDLITFNVQSGGSGLLTAQQHTLSVIGERIFLAGVILQAVSYIVFVVLIVVVQSRRGWRSSTDRLFLGLYFASLCILIRCAYRIAEIYSTSIRNREDLLFYLDALPLALGNFVWVLLWPPVLLQKVQEDDTAEKDPMRLPRTRG